MRKNLKHSIFLFVAGCFAWLSIHAQDGFRNKAMLDSVPAAGFYQINLLPALSAALQQDMRDIRIIDDAGRQVPYTLKSDLPAFKESRFTTLPVISVKKETDKQTHVVIENTLGQSLDELLLIIRNADADRSVTLSGSDDNQHWFVIKERIYLNHFFRDTADRFVQSLNFPKSSYHFFKIIINGKDILPVNIVKAGVYEQSRHTGKYLPLPAPVLLQKDSSDKYSYVFIKFDNFYFIDRILLTIRAPRFYNRTAEVYTGNIGSAVLQGRFTISSDRETVLPLAIKENRLLLKISNNDNPPLQIDGASAFQLNKYLLAYLEKKNYQLLFSDSAATAPVYDLEGFKDSIAGNGAALHYGPIERNIFPEKKAIAESDNRIVIWLALGAVVIVLILLTWKLTSQIKTQA